MFIANASDSPLKQTITTQAPEIYIPLWYQSQTTASTAGNVSGQNFLQKSLSNTIPVGAVTSDQYIRLYTLPSTFASTSQYALEVTVYSSASTITSYAVLWDFTANAVVSGSSVATTSTTATVLRSGKVNLITGRTYGVTVYKNVTTGTAYYTDASLIVFP